MSELLLPSFTSSSRDLNDAFRIALGDIHGNVTWYQEGLLDEPRPCLMAGLDYDTPWTRDAAINTWNACGLIREEVCRDTLLSVLTREEGRVVIGGQYWDAMIWTVGAWEYYLFTGDEEFLRLAFEATRNSLGFFEQTELDELTGLFRGPAVYGDGVAAYPDRYVALPDRPSGILAWPRANPDARARRGYGIPMHALSTNCVYARAYELATRIATELGAAADPSWIGKADALRAQIDAHFWDGERGTYRYLVDAWGGCDRQEGMGIAFAMLFGIAGPDRAALLCDSTHRTAAGIPCVWPTYERYASVEPGHSYGRHSGTVWPHIQGFWADACSHAGRADLAFEELSLLARAAARDAHFTEILHPDTGLPYGGLQEGGREGIRLWSSCRRQTWSATAFLRVILRVVFGIRPEADGLTFAPSLPPGVEEAAIDGLRYRGTPLRVELRGSGSRVASCAIDGNPADRAVIDPEGGHRSVEIELEP